MEYLIAGKLHYFLLAFSGFISLYLAINIGGNDLANAMGTSVGSGALTLKKAVLLSVLFNFLGAVLAGGHVTDTIRKGIVDPNLLASMPDSFVLGMLSALISSSVWIHLASHFGLPVSTTHSIVGAVVGFGIIAVGPKSISWGKLTGIVMSWIVSPVAGALVGGFMYWVVRRLVLSSDEAFKAAKFYAPFFFGLVLWVVSFSVFFEGLKTIDLRLTLGQTWILSLFLGLLAYLTGYIYIRRRSHKTDSWFSSEDSKYVDKLFGYLQIITACYVAFAHGSNDVANAVGPFAAIYSTLSTGSVSGKVEVDLWMLMVGGLAIGFGLTSFGVKVMDTIGKRITEVTKVRGFCAEFGAATTILVCSRLGLPISTTHVLVGSVIGVGFMRGMSALDTRVILNIISSWFLTIPFTSILSLLIYWVLTKLI
ncbi:MAG: inorganic phosphate transporter [Desulfatiglandales bacterium]